MEGSDLNKYLSSRSYLVGDLYSYADSTLYNLVTENPKKYKEFVHVQRWLKHIHFLKTTATKRSSDIGKNSEVCSAFYSRLLLLHY